MTQAGSVEVPAGGPSALGRREAAILAAVVLLAWCAGVLVPTVGPVAAWLVAAVAAAVAGWLCRRQPVLLLLALLPATLLVATGLVPEAGRYQPTAVVLVPLGLLWIWRLVRREVTVRLPDRTVLVVLVAYVGWCAVTTLTSTARGSSAVYLVGIFATLALIYGLAPDLLRRTAMRRAVLAVVAAMGIACVIAGVVLAFGPVTLFGQALGQYEIIELTVGGNPTGLVLPRILGPFLASNGQGINLALALIALVALRVAATGWARTLATIGAVVVLAALLVSMSRNGWLLAIVGLGTIAAVDLWRRRPSFAVATTTIMAVAFVLLLVNAFGADQRSDLMAARYGAAGSDVSGDLAAPPSTAPLASQAPAAPSAPATPALASPPAASPVPASSPVASTSSPAIATPAGSPAAASPVAAAPTREPLRGGSGLTGRLDLWKAAIKAVERRPLVGWGLGQVIEAIAPYVPPELAGLTSHSTWLRAMVETGVPGLLAVLAWVLVSGILILRRLRDPIARADPIRLSFVGAFLGLTAAATFDTFLLGGLTFMNIYWALSAVLAVAAASPAEQAVAAA